MTGGRPTLHERKVDWVNAAQVYSREARHLCLSQRRFVFHFCNTGDAILAAHRAGYSRSAATARRLLKDDRVSAAIAAERTAMAAELEQILSGAAP